MVEWLSGEGMAVVQGAPLMYLDEWILIYKNNMKKLLTVFCLLILSGCTLHAEFSPEKKELND